MSQGFEYRIGRRWAWLASAAVLVAGATQAQTTYAVAVSGGGLEPALLSLAGQTRQQIMFPKEIVAGLRAPGVKGRMTPEQALAQLLAGTDLRARRVNPGLVVVERPGAAEVTGEGPFGDGADAPLVTASAGAGPAPSLVDEVLVTGSNIRGAPPPRRCGPSAGRSCRTPGTRPWSTPCAPCPRTSPAGPAKPIASRAATGSAATSPTAPP